MKKVLGVVGVLVVIYLLVSPIRVYFMRQSAAQYATDALLAIMHPWDANALINRASESLKASPQDGIANRIEMASELLGAFSEISSGPTCEIFLAISKFDNKERVYSKCTANLKFEKRPSPVTIVLVKLSGNWYINDLMFK